MDAAVPIIDADARLEAPAIDLAGESLTTLDALEAALHHGLLDDWRRAVSADPLASLYQSPGWCMPWYRAYRDAYEPHVIVVRSHGSVVGVVPMAVDRQTGDLVFASDTMADYRDIVARPGYREAVVEHLVRAYLAGGFRNPLQV